MKTADRLDVFLDGKKVGTMVPYKRFLTAFEYSQEWLQSGFSISPYSLPLQPGVKIAKADPFDGLFGIFADSLPDGWGRLLVDRMLRKTGERAEEISPFARLSIVGVSGMGALEYKPAFAMEPFDHVTDLDRLAEQCLAVLQAKESDDLDLLFALGGSSGGARPKVLLRIDQEEWIVKFPSAADSPDVGLMEYEYTQCAKECGIEVPGIRLFPSKNCAGYFGSRRFDRVGSSGKDRKIHMASVSALLEVSHRIPALDYTSLMALTWQLTKQTEELEQLFARMCFNVFAHNRDDHSNNFSFLCEAGRWRLAPAYDLTYSSSLGGEHATSVAGEGRAPSMEHLLLVAKKAGLKGSASKETAERIQETVYAKLGRYLK